MKTDSRRSHPLQLGAPQLLTAAHILESFACSDAGLDEWLKRRALAQQASGASHTFVVADPGRLVHGYYAIAAAAISQATIARSVQRGAPDSIPVMVLTRLAVDQRARGIGLGTALLRDAVHRAAAVSRNAGVRVLLVHAFHDRARRFCEYHGFGPSPQHPMTLMLRLDAVRA